MDTYGTFVLHAGSPERLASLCEQRVLLDNDLAALYGVETRHLNEQVRRIRDRFPKDFVFALTPEEFAKLKSQFATSSPGGHGGRRWPTS